VSQENVERVERLYEHLDNGEIDAGLAVLDPDVQWWTRRDNPDTALVRGRDGWRAHWTQITDVLEEFRQEPTEVIDAGEYVIVCVHQSARMRGAVIEQDEVHVARLRDGYVIEFREFHEKGEALKAVGLEE